MIARTECSPLPSLVSWSTGLSYLYFAVVVSQGFVNVAMCDATTRVCLRMRTSYAAAAFSPSPARNTLPERLMVAQTTRTHCFRPM